MIAGSRSSTTATASLPSCARRTESAWFTRICDCRIAEMMAASAISRATALPSAAASSWLLPSRRVSAETRSAWMMVRFTSRSEIAVLTAPHCSGVSCSALGGRVRHGPAVISVFSAAVSMAHSRLATIWSYSARASGCR
jgi:hypothetical protein